MRDPPHPARIDVRPGDLPAAIGWELHRWEGESIIRRDTHAFRSKAVPNGRDGFANLSELRSAALGGSADLPPVHDACFTSSERHGPGRLAFCGLWRDPSAAPLSRPNSRYCAERSLWLPGSSHSGSPSRYWGRRRGTTRLLPQLGFPGPYHSPTFDYPLAQAIAFPAVDAPFVTGGGRILLRACRAFEPPPARSHRSHRAAQPGGAAAGSGRGRCRSRGPTYTWRGRAIFCSGSCSISCH
jgi:hypothetical protein